MREFSEVEDYLMLPNAILMPDLDAMLEVVKSEILKHQTTIWDGILEIDVVCDQQYGCEKEVLKEYIDECSGFFSFHIKHKGINDSIFMEVLDFKALEDVSEKEEWVLIPNMTGFASYSVSVELGDDTANFDTDFLDKAFSGYYEGVFERLVSSLRLKRSFYDEFMALGCSLEEPTNRLQDWSISTLGNVFKGNTALDSQEIAFVDWLYLWYANQGKPLEYNLFKDDDNTYSFNLENIAIAEDCDLQRRCFEKLLDVFDMVDCNQVVSGILFRIECEFAMNHGICNEHDDEQFYNLIFDIDQGLDMHEYASVDFFLITREDLMSEEYSHLFNKESEVWEALTEDKAMILMKRVKN